MIDGLHTYRPSLPPVLTWIDKAACADADKQLFYPQAFNDPNIAVAKALCEGCPVKAECLDDALARKDQYGIWGGLEPWERRSLVRRTRLTNDKRRRGENP